ncbi:copper chaperone PCu(A)C [Streptomyces specialis]|uniref:copper chaperone PCu(A)C n=1 Tax=Streptomyces specialis TaxID=498367 RepID=UPI00073E2941|nr:copper chaperone PCu(A)C [Streptomyces specialis]
MTAATRARAATAAAALACALTLTACGNGDGDGGGDGGGPELTVTGAFIPEPATGDMAGGFLTVENAGDTDDALVAATSDIAGSVEIHETVDNAMRRVDSLPVPARGALHLSRGGNHLMFLDLTHQPAEGDTVSVELHFATSDPITLNVPVEAATHTGE